MPMTVVRMLRARARRWGRVLFQGGAQGGFSWQWTYVPLGDGMGLRRVTRRLQSHTPLQACWEGTERARMLLLGGNGMCW